MEKEHESHLARASKKKTEDDTTKRLKEMLQWFDRSATTLHPPSLPTTLHPPSLPTLHPLHYRFDRSVAPVIHVGNYLEPEKAFKKKDGFQDPHVRLLTRHLALGSLFVGMPGAGKTVGMKKMVEEIALLNSMVSLEAEAAVPTHHQHGAPLLTPSFLPPPPTQQRHVIILDVKGDWSQIIEPNTKATKDRFGERGAEVRIFTFGTEHGWRATLDPFIDFGEKDPKTGLRVKLADMNRDQRCSLHGRMRLFVKDVLTSVALIKVDGTRPEAPEVLTSNSMPALHSRAVGQHESEDKRAIAGDLVAAVWQVMLNFYEVKSRPPQDYNEFATAIETEARLQALHAAALAAPTAAAVGGGSNGTINGHGGGQGGPPLGLGGGLPQRHVMLPPSLTSADLEYTAAQIRAEVAGPLALLYEKASGEIGEQKESDTYRLDVATLCEGGAVGGGDVIIGAETSAQQKCRISVIQLFNLYDDLMKQRGKHPGRLITPLTTSTHQPALPRLLSDSRAYRPRAP